MTLHSDKNKLDSCANELIVPTELSHLWSREKLEILTLVLNIFILILLALKMK